MSEQPEALKLAEKLEGYSPNSGYATYCHKAAAELRRLHEVNGELLYALEDIEMVGNENGGVGVYLAKLARKAIAKAEGETA